jgi:hypothetical protein
MRNVTGLPPAFDVFNFETNRALGLLFGKKPSRDAAK